MKKFLSICLFATSLSLHAANQLPLPNPLPMTHYENASILFTNQILTKIDGKAISALDIRKRMDFIFNRQFPDLAKSSSRLVSSNSID